MKRHYYYLIASLPELLSGDDYKNHPYPEFLQLCEEELSGEDLLALKKCFLFNDIDNICYKTDGPLTQPAFYSDEDLEEAGSDNDLFFPFISDVLNLADADTREYSGVDMERAMVTGLYEQLDEITSGFTAEYLRFELLARNIATALSFRSLDKPYADLIIKADFLSERIAISPAPDFGLGGEIAEFSPVLDAFRKQQPIEIERAFDRIRWDWLDDTNHVFTADAVSAYAVKLSIVERWLTLDPDEGRKMLDNLIEGAGNRAASMIHEQLEV